MTSFSGFAFQKQICFEVQKKFGNLSQELLTVGDTIIRDMITQNRTENKFSYKVKTVLLPSKYFFIRVLLFDNRYVLSSKKIQKLLLGIANNGGYHTKGYDNPKYDGKSVLL